MKYICVFFLLYMIGCKKADDVYFACLSDPFSQYNWQLAEMKVFTSDTFVIQFEPKALYFNLVNQGVVANKKQFALYLKERLYDNDIFNIQEIDDNYIANKLKYYLGFSILSKRELFDKYIDKYGYIDKLLIPDEQLPSFLLRLQDFRILVDQEEYSGRLKVYEPSEAWERISAWKASLPQ